ncbi:MAG: hypothetical protein M4579_003516 [Chaenotheca gracillima]|nr:MAG: hypothetical protein M4579_003516 [Chaenotheca gracillima]
MAPRSGLIAKHHGTSSQPNDPPPSTIAAQIVHDLSDTNGHHGAKDQENFEQLLLEILDTTNGSLKDENVIGTDLSVNSNLIVVVTKAGLNTICTDDPFAAIDHLLSRARNSLSVIELVIKRTPKVLFTSIVEKDLNAKTIRPPLYTWLLPRTLALLKTENASSLAPDVVTFLKSCLRTLCISSQTWSDQALVSAYLRCCVNTVLSHLESTLGTSSLGGPFAVLSVPPSEFIVHLRPEASSSTGDIDNLQFQINTAKQAAGVLLHLLSIFAPESSDVSKKSSSQATAPELSWALSIIFIVRNLIPRKELSEPARELVWDKAATVTATKRPELKALWQELADDRHGALEEDVDRPLKRLRLSVEGDYANDRFKTLVQKVFRLLGSQPATDLDGLARVASHCFAQLSTVKQCEFLKCLGDIACAGANTLGSSDISDTIGHDRCSVCFFDGVFPYERKLWQGEQKEEVVSTIKLLLDIPVFRSSTSPRMWAMMTIRKVLLHSDDPEYVNLATSPLGQWCLQSLCSSVRELRIAAGKTLVAFLAHDPDRPIQYSNLPIVLDFLRRISSTNELALQETCLMAWSQIARVATDDEFNIVLLRLVEYLGHTNPLISGLAYNELLRISDSQNVAPLRLFAPFWRNVAITAVQNLQTRPQITQVLSELLGISISEFLVLTQKFTLPYLVLSKKKEVIQRIAQARNDGSTVGSMCYEKANMASILALLFVQESTDIESTVMSLLSEASEEFKSLDMIELARSDPILIACELLKVAGEQDPGTRPKTISGIQLLAGLAGRRTSQSRTPVKKSSLIGQFFETHVLGIMAQFSDAINENQGRLPLLEKRRCLKGIQEMCRLAKSYISNALPQICACLQAALGVDELRGQAFGAWSTLVSTLEEEEIGSILQSTFSIVVQFWPKLSLATQGAVQSMIVQLLQKHSKLLRENVNSLPSLSTIPALADVETQLKDMRATTDVQHQFQSFVQRCQHENPTVVKQSLSELIPFLQDHQSWIHISAVSEQPSSIIADLTRVVLDACVNFADTGVDIPRLCGQCVGLIGCLDPNRVETVREEPSFLTLSNFERADETIDWVLFFLQEILVKAFLSSTNTKAQGFLAYVMQELLKFCDISSSSTNRTREDIYDEKSQRWDELPEGLRNTLTPFLSSKYILSTKQEKAKASYPIFHQHISHGFWLREICLEFLENGTGTNAQTIFRLCSRIVRGQDISIAAFLLPYAALNVAIGGTDEQAQNLGQEFLHVLSQEIPDESFLEENVKLCSETVFQVLEYLSKWMQEQKRQVVNVRSSGRRGGQSSNEDEATAETYQIHRVEKILAMIPPDVISRRAVQCKSYARALFHWEQQIRQTRKKARGSHSQVDEERMFERLQEIYTQIDEPDGIEGISTHLHVLDIDQQILEHRKAGRWTAVQSWYELLLAQEPNDAEVQVNLLTCLRESGQYDVVLNQVDAMGKTSNAMIRLLPFAVEASWVTGKWNRLGEYLEIPAGKLSGDFNVRIGHALLALHKKDFDQFDSLIVNMREDVGKGLSRSSTSSLQACHDDMLKLHALNEIEIISGSQDTKLNRSALAESLDRRLEVVGAFLSDKQYLLGLRRATMQLSKYDFTNDELAIAWLTSARLARKGNFTHQSFNAVLHASQLGAKSATIEHARLLWIEGHHRKAIQSLQGAINANVFQQLTADSTDVSTRSSTGAPAQKQTLVTARAHLLLTKWLDSAGQSQAQLITQKYREAANTHLRWEKGHYYLGRHYNKLLESEKALPLGKQATSFIDGETAKLVIDSYLRSMCYGTKYLFQTLPRILTLWLGLGMEVESPVDPRYGNKEEFKLRITKGRKAMLEAIHEQLKKYMIRLPAFTFYTALQQIVARICHPNMSVFNILRDMIIKVVSTHPQQALWTLLAVVKSSSEERSDRGLTCLVKLRDGPVRGKPGSTEIPLKAMVNMGQRLSESLLTVGEIAIQGKPSVVSLSKDLHFNSRVTPCPLVVPLEKTLTATLPTVPNNIRSHKAFATDTVTISQFRDEVVVLNSLQRPRKLSVRGSDGKMYGLLCKPKDDLRKDQRLMEFNSTINRSLKKDAESSKRQLYIKTYAVTPLNEECGLIEWIDNLKTLRDILLKLYKSRGISPHYGEIRLLLEEASSNPSKISIFTDKILQSFPPLFHEWFVELFPEPSAWFNARLRYTRSCAVMSMVGMTLGLGDRHGENILFEEGNGGTFHVDFNCLFDKGLTFDKPELVPFRLTHNMVDAFGVYGYEGPFRKSCELTLKILRQNENTLLTIMETFVYDPTTDFIGKKKRSIPGVPGTPQEVLDSVQSKVRGLLRGESVPLSIEGHVDELIRQATDPQNLSSMYIGWCAFF